MLICLRYEPIPWEGGGVTELCFTRWFQIKENQTGKINSRRERKGRKSPSRCLRGHHYLTILCGAFGTTILYGTFFSFVPLREIIFPGRFSLVALAQCSTGTGIMKHHRRAVHSFIYLLSQGSLLWQGGDPRASPSLAIHLPLLVPQSPPSSTFIPPLSPPGQTFDPSQAVPQATLPAEEDGEDWEEGTAQKAVSSLVWPEAASELAQRLVLHHLAGLPPGASLRDDARALMASQVRINGSSVE